LRSHAKHLVSARHLEVENCPRPVHQALDVSVLDVSAILSQVGRDPVCASPLTRGRRRNRIRVRSAASLAQRRDVIDVDVEA